MAEEQELVDGRTVGIPGWRLLVAHMALREDRDRGNVMDTATKGAIAELGRALPGGLLEKSAPIRALRQSLRSLGLDPAATPPSSELLLARLLESPTSIRGGLVREFLGILTIRSQAPWSVLDRARIEGSLRFRNGRPGERLETADGTLQCDRLPVLADAVGVRASPFAVCSAKEPGDCHEPVFVCYLPEELFRAVGPRSHMGRTVWFTWAYRFVQQRTCSYPSDGT